MRHNMPLFFVARCHQIAGRAAQDRVSHEAFVNQSGRHRAAGSTPPRVAQKWVY
jgi:hypothetical protein